MQKIYLIDNKGSFKGSFPSIRDAKNFAFHEHILNYHLKRVLLKES